MAGRMRYALLALGVAALAGVAAAGSLQIGPTSVTLIGKERTATITGRNSDAAPVNVQIRAMDWTQANGEDVHKPSSNLMVSPPFVTLQPGEAQTVRLLVENVPDVKSERAFRLVIDEVPGPLLKTGNGVSTTLRLLSPVFLSPSTSAAPKLVWSAKSTADGIVLTARNDGAAHERLSALSITAGGRTLAEGANLGGYVLGKAARSWSLPDIAGTVELVITGQGAQGPVNARAVIAR